MHLLWYLGLDASQPKSQRYAPIRAVYFRVVQWVIGLLGVSALAAGACSFPRAVFACAAAGLYRNHSYGSTMHCSSFLHPTQVAHNSISVPRHMSCCRCVICLLTNRCYLGHTICHSHSVSAQ